MTDTRTQVVFNDERGGFCLSHAALWVAEKLYKEDWEVDEPERHDPRLVELVSNMGPQANGPRASLTIKTLEYGHKYRIYEDLGEEWVEEPEDIRWIDAREDT